jgi:hypothetical protein
MPVFVGITNRDLQVYILKSFIILRTFFCSDPSRTCRDVVLWRLADWLGHLAARRSCLERFSVPMQCLIHITKYTQSRKSVSIINSVDRFASIQIITILHPFIKPRHSSASMP